MEGERGGRGKEGEGETERHCTVCTAPIAVCPGFPGNGEYEG